jgi:hypothetical protein
MQVICVVGNLIKQMTHMHIFLSYISKKTRLENWLSSLACCNLQHVTAVSIQTGSDDRASLQI